MSHVRMFLSIVCRTGEAKDLKEIDREVRVSVADRSKTTVPYEIQGSATTEHESFSYKVLFSFPICRKMNLYLTGS